MDPALARQKSRGRVLLGDVHAIVPGAGVEVDALAGGDVEGPHVLGGDVVARAATIIGGKVMRI